MAYATTADAGFRITSVTHNSTAIKGAIRATVERIVEREVLQADAENTPISRPIDRLDARATFACLDGSGMVAAATAAANCVVNFTQGDGGAGSVTVGPMLANGFSANFARNQGGHIFEQEFVFQGTTLTETLSF